jgi:hypothetical protein
MNGYELAEEIYNNIGDDENCEISNDDVVRVISFWGYNESSSRSSRIGFVCYCAREKIRKAFERGLVYGDFKLLDELMTSINNYRNKQSESSEMTIEEATEALLTETCDRIEYGTDGNAYKMSISNGKEFETCVNRGV